MRKVILASFACVLALQAQTNFNAVNILPRNGAASPISYYNDTGATFIALKAPSSPSVSITFTLPGADGTMGQSLCTNGAATLDWCTSGGSPAAPVSSVQFNGGTAFGGSGNFTWNNSLGQLAVCVTLNAICNGLSGITTQAFNSAATGTATAFEANMGAFLVTGAGDLTTTTAVAHTFTSNATSGIGYSNNGGAGAFAGIYQNGEVAGQWLALADQASAPPPSAGNAIIYPTATGLFLSLNGGAYVPLGPTLPAAPTNSVQFNSGGTAFGGSSNLTWNGSLNQLAVCPVGCASNAGVTAQSFASSATGTDPAFNANMGAFEVFGNGTFQGQSMALTNGWTAGMGAYSLTAGGALTVSSCTGCGLTPPGGPSNSIQYNTGSGFGGTSNFTWNNSLNQATILGSAASGFTAPVFNSTNTGTDKAFEANMGAAIIFGNGNIQGQALALQNGWTAGAGMYGLTAAGVLTVASCTGCGAGTPGGANGNVQYNSMGGFGGSSAFTFNSTTGNVGATTFTGSSFTSTATGGGVGYSNNGGGTTFAAIYGNGEIAGQWLALADQGSLPSANSGNATLAATASNLFLALNGGPFNALATQTYVTSQGYVTSSFVTSQGYITSVTGGTGVNCTGSTTVTCSIGQAVGTTNNVTFNSLVSNGTVNCNIASSSTHCFQQQGGTFFIQADGTGEFQSVITTQGILMGTSSGVGSFQVIDTNANVVANHLRAVGLPTGSGGVVACIDASGNFYRGTTSC